MKYLLALILITSLSGCAQPKPEILYRTQIIKVPVYQAPVFDIPSRPILDKDLLTEEDRGNHSKIVRAWVISINTLEVYTLKLLNILESIKEKPNTTP